MAENSGAEKSSFSLREIVRNRRTIWWTGGAIVLAALVIVILWKVPQWQVGHYSGLTSSQWFDKVNEARKTLATILGGLVVLAGGFATWRNLKLAQESLRVSQEGQITDRFTKAIEQLGAGDTSGKKKLEVRLGGIYALERIANQSERDHWPIVEVLSTYVRENAPKPKESSQESQSPTPHPTADIEAILEVLGRRDRKYEGTNQYLDLWNVDIRGAYLNKARLSGTILSGADLSDADLSDADLSNADLIGAKLIGAKLIGAKLGAAHLSGANFSGAKLSGADLSDADLSDADLSNADLIGAKLIGAKLNGTKLSGAQLVEADLSGADLSDAYLNYANLSGADLGRANLAKAGIYHANLSRANLRGADLAGARVSETNLRETQGLTQEQVDVAIGNSATQLPEDLHMPESWKK